jgi:hypothetical protein
MQDVDLEFVRLKLAERATHDRFVRLSGIAGICEHPEVLKAAHYLWNEATAAVLVYQRSVAIIAMSGGR